MVDKKQKPFLYVIENIDKVNIDNTLKPTFIEVLKLLQNYFEKNDLLDVKDYGAFFDEFLIGEGKSAIQFVPSSATKRHNNYNQETKNIEIIDWSNEFDTEYKTNNASIHTMLHEFVHFLVHRQPINEKITTDPKLMFLDEGFTENLTEAVTDLSFSIIGTGYKDNVDSVDLIKSVIGQKEAYKVFLQGYDLNDKILNNNNEYIMDLTYLHIFDNRPEFINTPLSNSEKHNLICQYRVKAQRDLINSFPIKQCENIDEFIKIVQSLSQRQLLDKEFMDDYYNKYKLNLLNQYKAKRSISQDEEQTILSNMDKLINEIESFDRYNCEDLYRLKLGEDKDSVEICINKKRKYFKKKAI